MKLRLLDTAYSELVEATDYYESISEELRRRFLDDYYETLTRLEMYPEAWHPVDTHIRRIMFSHFPYALLYHVEKDIIILAVMHLHQKPGYWKSRIRG